MPENSIAFGRDRDTGDVYVRLDTSTSRKYKRITPLELEMSALQSECDGNSELAEIFRQVAKVARDTPVNKQADFSSVQSQLMKNVTMGTMATLTDWLNESS